MYNIYELDESWNGIGTIIPFGYGRIGRRVLSKLQVFFEIPFIIENDKSKTNTHNIRLLSFKEAKNEINNRKIVVLTTEIAYEAIRTELISAGYVENRDFTILSRFLGEYFLKNEHKLYLSKLDTIITSKCSLRCPHCAGFIPYCTNQHDVPIEELCSNFDTIFSVIDYVLEYCLLGGEPLLYKDLSQLIEYIMTNYGEKIGKLVLISNGNAVLSEEIVNTLVTYNIKLAISNYTQSVNYTEYYRKLLDTLEKNNIDYSINTELVWKDHGYPLNPSNYKGEEVRTHMKTCGHTCPSAYNGKIYYCDVMVSAELMTEYDTHPDDVIDINDELTNISHTDLKKRIFSYLMGEINSNGAPSFCALCRGIGKDNESMIEPGR